MGSGTRSAGCGLAGLTATGRRTGLCFAACATPARRASRLRSYSASQAGAVAGSALPKDLVAIKETARAADGIREQLGSLTAPLLANLREQFADLGPVAGLIEHAIVDDPPPALKSGGFIRSGFDAELDQIVDIRAHAKDWIRRFEAEERRRTGIPVTGNVVADLTAEGAGANVAFPAGSAAPFEAA